MTKSATLRLVPAPHSVRLARRFVASHLPEQLPPDARDRLILLVSETVTNAVQHAGGPVTLHVHVRPDDLLIEIDDDAPALPRSGPLDPSAEHGRGMYLLQQLADQWGTTPHPGDGKTVWFTINTMTDALRTRTPRRSDAPVHGPTNP